MHFGEQTLDGILGEIYDKQKKQFKLPEELMERGLRRAERRLDKNLTHSIFSEAAEPLLNQVTKLRSQSQKALPLLPPYGGIIVQHAISLANPDTKISGNPTDPLIDSDDDSGRLQIISGLDFINLEAINQMTGPLLILGDLEDYNRLLLNTFPELPFKRNGNLAPKEHADKFIWVFPLAFAPEKQKEIEREAKILPYSWWEEMEAHHNDLREAIIAICIRGAFGKAVSLQWLEQNGYMTTTPHPTIDKLIETREMITPIDPRNLRLTDWESPKYLTTYDKVMAMRVLEEVADQRQATVPQLLKAHCKQMINGLFASGEIDLHSEDTNLTSRFLHTLIVKGYRGVARQALWESLFEEDYNRRYDFADALGAALEDGDSRPLEVWTKICAKLGGRGDEASGFADLAQELADKAEGVSPDDPDLYLRLEVARAKALSEQENFDLAAQLLRNVWAEIGKKAEEDFSLLLTRGYVLAKMGRDDAKWFLEKAFEMSEGDPRPLHLLGLLDKHQGRFDKAKGRFQEITQTLDAQNVHALHAEGKLAAERGHLRPDPDTGTKGAEALFEEVLAIEPDNVFALVELGKVHSAFAEWDGDENAYMEAKRCFQQVLQHSPYNAYALTSWADLEIEYHKDWNETLSQRVRNLLNTAEAVDGKEAAIETLDAKRLEKREEGKREAALGRLEGWDNLTAQNMEMQIRWKRNEGGDREAVRLHFRKVERDAKDSWQRIRSFNTYADLLRKAEEFAQAEGWYKESLKVDKDNAFTRFFYGLMLKEWSAQSGDAQKRDTAREHLRQAHRLGLTLKLIEDALAELEER